jgi:hypothetical protein
LQNGVSSGFGHFVSSASLHAQPFCWPVVHFLSLPVQVLSVQVGCESALGQLGAGVAVGVAVGVAFSLQSQPFCWPSVHFLCLPAQVFSEHVGCLSAAGHWGAAAAEGVAAGAALSLQSQALCLPMVHFPAMPAHLLQLGKVDEHFVFLRCTRVLDLASRESGGKS